MSGNSKIEWTDATWNPIVGCSIVSPGCTNCYAMTMAARIEAINASWPRPTHYAGTTQKVNGNAVWTGKVALAPHHILTAPLGWRRRPQRIFVNSMGDLFHESIPDQWIDRVFAVMAVCSQQIFQCLTKRPERMLQYLSAPRVMEHIQDVTHPIVDYEVAIGAAGEAGRECVVEWPLPNVWLGVSAERQQEADERIPLLLNTPAALRFVSAEPLLGPIDLTRFVFERVYGTLDWVIVGGESGPNARPCHPDWVRSIRDQCQAAKVPFFFKQWGEWAPGECAEFPATRTERVACYFDGEWSYSKITPRVSAETHIDDEPDVYRIGKSRAGRLLDGRSWNEFPP